MGAITHPETRSNRIEVEFVFSGVSRGQGVTARVVAVLFTVALALPSLTRQSPQNLISKYCRTLACAISYAPNG